MADIWDAMYVRVEKRGNEMTLHVSINGFNKVVKHASRERKLLTIETIESAEEIVELIRSVIRYRVREQLEEIEQAEEPGDFTKGNY